MAISVVRLGTPRNANEGLRIGTVRRPPRGVPKAQFGKLNYYDVWLPILSPSAELVAFAQKSAGPGKSGEKSWKAFEKRYRAEMKNRDAARTLDLLSALSQQTNFSVGCYCENEARCHRSILRKLLAEHGAALH